MGDLLLLRPVATTLHLIPTQLDQIDVQEATIVDGLERIHLTLGDHELVVEGEDLVDSIDRLRKALDDAEANVLDARHDLMVSLRRECPWCPTLIEADEPDCGAPSCTRWTAIDIAGGVP